MPDGRSLEEHYQCDVKGYDIGGRNWRLGKGKPPLVHMTFDEQFEKYKQLWVLFLTPHPNALPWLRKQADKHAFTLTDCFATTPINQAHALVSILNSVTP